MMTSERTASPAGVSRTQQQLHLFSAPLYCEEGDGRCKERGVTTRGVADRLLHETRCSMGGT
jgi:hypothetical protein